MRRLAILLLALFSLLAVGCGDARYHLTVNRDGSGDLDLRVSLDNLTLDLLGQVGADPLMTLREALEEDGYAVSVEPGANQREIIARKHVPKLTPQGLGVAAIPRVFTASATAPEGIQVRRGLLNICYRFEGEIDPASFALVQELDGLESYLLAKMQYEFALTLPVPADEHNADAVSEGGKTLVWQLIPGEKNRVLVEASQWNPAGLAAFALLLLMLGVGAYCYFRSSKEDEEEKKAPPGDSTYCN